MIGAEQFIGGELLTKGELYILPTEALRIEVATLSDALRQVARKHEVASTQDGSLTLSIEPAGYSVTDTTQKPSVCHEHRRNVSPSLLKWYAQIVDPKFREHIAVYAKRKTATQEQKIEQYMVKNEHKLLESLKEAILRYRQDNEIEEL